MGKERRQRKKLHLEGESDPSKRVEVDNSSRETDTAQHPLMKLDGNIFEGLNINIDSLNKKLPDDLRSVKSFKSIRSELGKSIPKKDKLKIRRETFLKKFEIMEQMKKEKKLLQKRKSTPVVGDMNPLHDALPSLESLLKSKANNLTYDPVAQPKKSKGIEKAAKQKKKQLQGIKTFQQVYKNKQFLKDPQTIIAQHIKTILNNEKSNK